MKDARLRQEPGPDECRGMSRLCLSTNLRRTERLVTRHYDAYLAKAGVTAVQLPILALIAIGSEPSFRLLASELDLDRSTLSRNLSLLERDGLVEVGPSSGPKPGLISLTRKGRTALQRGYRQWTEAHRELEKILTGDSLAAGLEFLKSLRRGVREMRKSRDGAG